MHGFLLNFLNYLLSISMTIRAPTKATAFPIVISFRLICTTKSPISDQNVLMKDAAQKTPRKSAVFSHIYQFFRCKKLENEIFQRHDLRARAVRVGAEH